jgi:hypothetical protein
MLRRSSRVIAVALRRWPGHPQQRHQLHSAPARDASFGTVHADDISFFKSILGGDSGVVTDPDAVAPHNQDWMRKYTGSSTVVVKPRSSEQVSQLLAYCSLKRLAVVPQVRRAGGSLPCTPPLHARHHPRRRLNAARRATGRQHWAGGRQRACL